MDKLSVALEAVNAAKTSQGIIELNDLQDLWVNRYTATTGRNDGNLKFENEKLNFLRVFQENPKLEACTPFSKYTALMDLCTSGLTLSEGISYIFSMDNKSVIFMPSWKGRLEQMKDLPDVKFVYDPEVVYDCDTFTLTRTGPIKTIEHVSSGKSERTSESKPVHVYMYIEFEDGRIICYEKSAIDVLRIRDQRSKSFMSYAKALANEKLNSGKKMGDRVKIQYKDNSTQQWKEMEIDPPMGVTDIEQYFKKTLVRSVWNGMKKLPSQKILDQRIQDAIKHAESIDPSHMLAESKKPVVEETVDEKTSEFTDYEEVNGENVNTATGEIDSKDIEGETF